MVKKIVISLVVLLVLAFLLYGYLVATGPRM